MHKYQVGDRIRIQIGFIRPESPNATVVFVWPRGDIKYVLDNEPGLWKQTGMSPGRIVD